MHRGESVLTVGVNVEPHHRAAVLLARGAMKAVLRRRQRNISEKEAPSLLWDQYGEGHFYASLVHAFYLF